MPTNLDNCVVCGHENFCPIEAYESDRIKTNYMACSHCGLVVMNPMPTDDELKEYYSDNYWELSGDAVKQSLQKQQSRAAHLKKYIKLNTRPHFFKDVSSISEIGSSFGVTLHHLGTYVKSIGGEARLFAIEPSQNSVRIGQDYYKGINLLGFTVEDLSYNYDATFDLIILSHVLEHFTNPVASLTLIADKMTDSSLLYIEVPNFYGHPSVQYAHNYCFTETSLMNCLAVAHLKPVEVNLFWHSRIFPMNITCLARKDSDTTSSGKICKETIDEIVRQRKAGQVAHRRHVVLTDILKRSRLSSVKYPLLGIGKKVLRRLLHM